MSKLTDRLRAIVDTPYRPSVRLKPDATGASANNETLFSAVVSGFSRTGTDLERVLGGEWRDHNGASCFVVERRSHAESTYGRQTVGQIARALADSSAAARAFAGDAAPQVPFVFFDLETTGLSGGAGTYAFLIGCGWFDADQAFVTRQFVLVRFADERHLLAFVSDELSRAGALVSFNGKSFDAPILETRYLFHRLDWIGARLPHVDVLHPARRFWKTDSSEAEDTRCSLISLETEILGARRTGDVPGCEIPARYFQFVRSGDARPLSAVLEHNRLDLLSLAGLTARLLDLVRSGPSAARDAREALALGRAYARLGEESLALEALECAVAARAAGIEITIAALRSLALALRRARRFNEAARCWQELLEVRGCPPHITREANEALAIHHEHRAHDLVVARAFALRLEPGRSEAVRHRVARIERKMGATLLE